MNNLDLQLAQLSAEGYYRCYQKPITAAFFFTLSFPLSFSLAPHINLYFFSQWKQNFVFPPQSINVRNCHLLKSVVKGVE